MLGYTYKDIQEFGHSLTWAIDNAPENYKKDLLRVWDFFEGLLGEGYIDENTFYGDDVPNEAMDYSEEMQLMGLDQ